jgi:hypothetical protein
MTDTLAWHFLPANRRTQYSDEPVEVGTILHATDRPLELCEYGLHACERMIDALTRAPGPILCHVKLSGEILRDTDELCAEHRECLWMRDVSRELLLFACRAVEDALLTRDRAGRRTDLRSWIAIATIRRCDGLATDEGLEVARAAAWAASCAATWASEVATWAVLRNASWAASCAAWAATDGAALGATRDKYDSWLVEMCAPQETQQ